MKALLVLAVGLGAGGVLPALAVARRSPVVVFLAPLTGAAMAALGATIELGAGGSIVADYLAVALIVNLAVIVWWLAGRRAVQPRALPARSARAMRGWSRSG